MKQTQYLPTTAVAETASEVGPQLGEEVTSSPSLTGGLRTMARSTSAAIFLRFHGRPAPS